MSKVLAAAVAGLNSDGQAEVLLESTSKQHCIAVVEVGSQTGGG